MRSPRPSLPVVLGILAVVVIALARSDEIRARASAGLGRGMPAREAALARGFVLGEDETIDAVTEEDFRRSGLAHLLAVSGENVTLLALLGSALLGAFGVPLRERLLWLLGLVAVYVPLAGAGPSIQRAAVMGAAGLVATLAGRRSSRLFALGLALAVTLAVKPAVATDVGWQLSFAAVLGILLLAAPLRDAVAARIGRGGWRRALAEGVAVTVAATLATAPLVAYHFETFSTTALLANVLALPAVAPAMWLGMAAAAASQVPGLPLEPLNALGSLLLAYIAQVASWCAAPGWAEVHVHLGARGLLAAYAGLAAAIVAALRIARWRRLRAARRRAGRICTPVGNKGAPWRALALVLLVAGGAFLAPWAGGGGATPSLHGGLRITVLDIGQGDAILLQPAHAAAVLVDGGPPGDGLAAKLADAGVERLGAAVISHDESDHAGGVEELFGRVPIARLIYARLRRASLAVARAAGAVPARVAAGGEVRSGALRLQVLWPPPELLSQPLAGADPNTQALVLLARWRDFTMLLTADAEAEAVPIDPGPVDVLKVAHHGSDDAGLGALLDRTGPRLAVISVGAENPFGHPTGATLATLSQHGVRTMRTDRDGTVRIDVFKSRFAIQSMG
ncbi:MAG TPA: ComEC/Rec2 family competence protein [Solirubrobacterales bacterium]|nr:ComEC/Rec2 family competence protein [Solirubrobacterales bacterium]